MLLIDAHAHLDNYPDDVVDRILEEIAARRILTISTAMDLPSYERGRAIASRCNLVIPAFGVHPRNALAHAHRLKELKDAIERSPILGEIRLDHCFVEDSTQYPAQRTVFEFFLAAARDQGKIVNLHTSGAEADVLDLLTRYGIRRAIVHWYAGPLDTLYALADRGAFFTVGVEILFSPRIQTIAREIPANRLLTETDNPDGLEWLTGAPGMPAALEGVIEKLAELRGLTPDLLIRTVGENFLRLVQDDPWLSDLRTSILERESRPVKARPAD